MYRTRSLLAAATGVALLAANMPAAMAHSVGDHDMWSGKVHGAYRNVRYCDSRVTDFLPAASQTDGDQSVFEKVSFLTGSDYFTDKFTIDIAGTYQVTLTDFEFPAPLAESGLNVTSATESFGSLIGPGSFSFDAQPGSYYLSFFATAPDLGQYGIEIAQYGIVVSQPGDVSAVPVPAAAWLFGSGLIGLAGVIRRKSA